MKQGTVSVLLGCHSPFHSVLVIVAWRRLYGCWPSWWEVVCIFLHDVGHWGKDYLDDYKLKRHHAELGAKIAGVLLGRKGYDLVLGHNVYSSGIVQSRLYKPDKYSWVIAPLWWMWTNTIFEPRLIRPGRTRMQSVRDFRNAMRRNWFRGLPKQGHDIYLEQWHGREALRSRI